MPLISNHKHKFEEKSTKICRSCSKVVGLGLVDLWEFPILSIYAAKSTWLICHYQQIYHQESSVEMIIFDVDLHSCYSIYFGLFSWYFFLFLSERFFIVTVSQSSHCDPFVNAELPANRISPCRTVIWHLEVAATSLDISNLSIQSLC